MGEGLVILTLAHAAVTADPELGLVHRPKITPAFWVLVRATGLVAYGSITIAVLCGLLVKTRPMPRRLPPALTVDLHRTLSLLGLGATALHGVVLLLDRNLPTMPWDLVLPGTGPYRPLWVGVGVATGELWLLVHLSFRYRRRIGVANWRRLHWATYAAFAGATAHGLMAGSDSERPWGLAVYLVAAAAVAGGTTLRAMKRRPAPPPRRPPAEASPPPAPAFAEHLPGLSDRLPGAPSLDPEAS
ncbi:MAG: ferric reductase-like transmembrane domain-containing protein [Thermoleophilia bacterium]